VLGFEPLEGSHTGQYLLEVFQNVLSRARVEPGYGAPVLCDHGQRYEQHQFREAARHRKRLRRQLRIPLLAHIINLAARRLISHTECDKVAEKLRKVSRWVGQNGSAQRREVWKKYCEVKLDLDMPVRWSSSYKMLSTGLRLKDGMFRWRGALATKDSAEMEITELEWQDIVKVLDLLTPSIMPHL